MELQIRITSQEAERLLVSITQDGIGLDFGEGRKVSFAGALGDINVRLVTEEALSVPSSTKELLADSTVEVPPKEQEQSDQLLKQLIEVRRQIASELGVSPFIIFHDSTLSKMCRLLPKDLQELKSIQGIGEAKLLKYGQRFLEVIKGFALSGQQA